MTWHRSEEEVEAIIRDMVARSKGKYITQGVTFNKSCPRQMDLLKKALMASASFSGLGKEMLALRFGDSNETQVKIPSPIPSQSKSKDTGNFL